MNLRCWNNKEEQKKPRECRNTGSNSYKDSGRTEQKRENKDSFRNRWFSNTDKEYAWPFNNLNITQKPELSNIKSENPGEQQNSFNLDNNELWSKTINEQNISLNKSNYLTYDKKVKAFKHLQPNNSIGEVQSAPKMSQKDDNCKVLSPSPHVSQRSFQNMTNYVKNTFRKSKPGTRKNSYYTYSSHRKNDPFANFNPKYAEKSKTNRRKSKLLD